MELFVKESENAWCVSTGKVEVEIKKGTGEFIWRDTQKQEVLLRETGKELVKNPLFVYSTGEEDPVRSMEPCFGQGIKLRQPWTMSLCLAAVCWYVQ